MDGDAALRELIHEDKWYEVLEYLNSEDVSEEDKRKILFNTDEDGWASLHHACYYADSGNNSIEVIKKMLQIGGMELMMIQNDFGETALHRSFNYVEKSDEFYNEVMDALSEAGVDMGKLLLIEDNYRLTPIDIAIHRGVSQSVIARLYEMVPETKQKVNTVGYSDNAKNTEDQLDYSTYAKALVEVVQSVEDSSGASFAVGLFAPWGTGKTKLWQLIRDETMKKDKRKQQNSDIRDADLTFFTKLCFVVRDTIELLNCCCGEWRQDIRIIFDVENQHLTIDEEAENIAVFIIVATCSLFGFIILVLLCNFSTTFRKKLRNSNPRMLQSSINLSNKVKAALKGQTIRNYNMRPCSLWSCARKLILLGWCVVFLTLSLAKDIIVEVIYFVTGCSARMRPRHGSSSKHIFVEFNAWVYNGTDNLWASLMKTMIDSIENEYSPNALRWHRVSVALSDEKPDDSLEDRKKKRKEAWERFKVRTIVSALVAVIGVCLAVFLVLSFNADCTKKDAQQNASLWCNNATRESVGALLIITSPLPFIGQMFKIFSQVLPTLFSSPVDLLLRHAAKSAGSERHDFGASTGFMGEVKKEMEYIFDFLDSEPIIDDKGRTWNARLSILVDDLDRCKPQTVVAVMQAVHLLLEGRNIRDAGGATCWLAIDTRIVKSCIDSEYGEVLRDAGVDGNDYLEKIIQLPFCIPEMTAKNKDSLMTEMFLPRQMDLNDIILNLRRIHILLNKEYVTEEDSDTLRKDLPPDLVVSYKYSSILETYKPYYGADEQIDIAKRFLQNVLNDNSSSEKMKNNVFRHSNLENNKDLAKVFLTYNQHIEAAVNLISRTKEVIQKSHFPSSASTTQEVSPCESSPETPINASRLGEATSVRSTINIFAAGIEAAYNLLRFQAPFPSTSTTQAAFVYRDCPPPINNTPNQEEAKSTGEVFSVRNQNHMFAVGRDNIMLPEERNWINAIAQLFPGKARTLKRVMNIYNVARNVAELRELPLENGFHRKLLLVILLAEVWPFRMSWLLQIAEDGLQEEALLKIKRDKGKYFTESRAGPAGMLHKLLKIDYGASSRGEIRLKDHFAKIPLTVVYSEIAQKVMYSSPDAVSALSQEGDPQIFQYLLEGKAPGGTNEACELTLADIYPTDFEKDFKNKVSLRPFLFNMHRYTLEKRSADVDNIIMCCDENTSDRDPPSKFNSLNLKYTKKTNYYEKNKNKNAGGSSPALDSGEDLS